MQLPLDQLKTAGQKYRAANYDEQRTILKSAREIIRPWDAITRCMLTRTFERAAGEEFPW